MRHAAALAALTVLPFLPAARLAAQAESGAIQTRNAAGVARGSVETSISGRVVTLTGRPVGGARVQARNLMTGRIGGTAPTAADGSFLIPGVPSGNYVLEAVDAAGQVVGTSPFILAAPGKAIATTITATGGVPSGVDTVGGFAATLRTTAAETVRYAAVAAGVAGVVSPPGVATASPSR